MARKRPVIVCRIRQNPKSDPKFHQIDRLLGEGRSIKTLFIILSMGFDLRRGWNINEWSEGAH